MTEAKGSDVRAACEAAAVEWEGPIYNMEGNESVGRLAALIERHLAPVVEAHIQAAAVEVRGKVVAYIREHYHVFRSEEFAREVENVVRALSIPTDALDAMLTSERIKLYEDLANLKRSGGEVDEEMLFRFALNEKQKQAALTQPAPERKEK